MTIKNGILIIGILLILAACGPKKVIEPESTGVASFDAAPRLTTSLPKRAMMQPLPVSGFNTEKYKHIAENGYKDPQVSPLSTFSIDVDTASYSNVRRMLRENQLPQPGAVRIEELINYFDYDYPQPAGNDPVAIDHELTVCPWNTDHLLLHIGLQAKEIDMKDAPQSNLVFLIDVSGSMYGDLPLVKAALKLLAQQMNKTDHISIVVYAGAAGVILPPTPGSDLQTIFNALDSLESGGATAGSEGIELAYELAEKNLIQGGNNRIILATDGDFNVGLTSEDALVRLIEEKRDKGIYLTVLGFGMLNYDDVTAEALADHGNGNYAYIDSLLEAKKVLVNQIGGTLLTVAKDVKVQVEFNPLQVKEYRLLGYENRLMAAEDFANDQKDAGEMGAGHTVTALYEIIPADGSVAASTLRYQQTTPSAAAESGELALVKYRYKKPDEETSRLLSLTVPAQTTRFSTSSDNQRFAAAVASWGMMLRHSKYTGNTDWEWIIETARSAKGDDSSGDRAEFIKLVELSSMLGPLRKVRVLDSQPL